MWYDTIFTGKELFFTEYIKVDNVNAVALNDCFQHSQNKQKKAQKKKGGGVLADKSLQDISQPDVLDIINPSLQIKILPKKKRERKKKGHQMK